MTRVAASRTRIAASFVISRLYEIEAVFIKVTTLPMVK
jgi:hypothetical protein